MAAETSSQKYQELRQRAEKILAPSSLDNTKLLDIDETRHLLHELHTHQIEIELQNEELWKTQQELMESRDRFTALYDFAPVGYLTVNDIGIVTEANLTVAGLLGVERKSLIQKALSHFICADDQDIYFQHRSKLLQTRERQSCELKLRNADGRLFDAHLESVIDSEGGTDQIRTCITDISQRKVLESRIKKSKKEWEESFDAIPDLVTIQDKDMRIVRANKATKDLFQIPFDEIIGKKCYQLFRGVSEPCPDCPELKTLHDHKNHSGFIIHDTLRKTFDVSSAAIIDENDQFQYIVHVAKDVTEQKKLEEHLFQAHKMEAIGTLASGIAHDFNNILQAIIGFAEMVSYDLPENSRTHSNISQVLQAAKRARELVYQILSFSRKKTLATIIPLRPHLVVKEVVKMMRSTMPASIQIDEQIDANSPPVLADPTQYHQIVVNLLTNAYHALQNDHGLISVKLAKKVLSADDIIGEPDVSPGEFVELAVSDTGCGMDKKTIARIFEPYFTTKDAVDGSGIGLAMVHGLVKSFGGITRVESEIGKGSLFRVYLRVAESESVSNDAVVRPRTTLPKGTERILVVDDEVAIVNLNKNTLGQLGYTITAHTSSLKALEDFRAHAEDFDLVITDMSMPDMTGKELIPELLAIRKDIPIILCTGYIEKLPEEASVEYGVKKVLLKPVARSTMAATVREVLDSDLMAECSL